MQVMGAMRIHGWTGGAGEEVKPGYMGVRNSSFSLKPSRQGLGPVVAYAHG